MQALTADILRLSQEAVQSRGRFSVALCGGSVLELLNRGLPLMHQAPLIDWSSWNIFWVDERHVSWNSPDSNYGSAKRLFLDHVPIPADRIHPVPELPDVEEVALAYERSMRSLLPLDGAGVPRLDIVLLGLGEDGHIASLFPGHAALFEDERLVVPVRDAPKPPPDRVTMTLPVLRAARTIRVVVTGTRKADMVARVLGEPHVATGLPAQMLLSVCENLVWMMDRDAAHQWERRS